MAASKCNSATLLIPVPPKSLIFLHEWWLVKQRKGLAVGGVASVERDRERVFLSSVIAEREEANVLHSEDGITILFRGFINTSRSSQNGVPLEVCQHFLVGFPHDWKKYSDIDGVTAFGDSTACSKKRDDDALPFSISDNDFTKRQDSILSNNCLAPKKICNGLGISFGNDSKQSESTNNMECSIVMKTMECECNNTASLNSSQLQVDMYNGEKGISDVAVESQAGNKKSGQSFMGMFDSNRCTGPVKPPTSTKKMKKDQFSGDGKEKQCIRQNIVLDASNSCNRMVTRSISKRSHTMPKDEKATIATVISPVRKARKRQELMTRKAPAEDEEDKPNQASVSDILSRSLNCPICIQLLERPVTTPCGHSFCLKCFEKWVRQGKRNCVKCRQIIPAKMASQPHINSALVFAIRMARQASNNNGSGGGVRSVNHFLHNQDRPDEPFTTECAQRSGRANAASGKIFVTVPTDHFGPITAENDPVRNQGLLVGETWRDRLECRQWGAHFVPVGGISGQSDRGAQSVVLSGGYADDEDHGEWFLYTGSGGKDLSGNKRTNKSHSFDQKFEKYNRALQVSCLQGYPVRLVRSHKEKRSSYAPENGMRYDGIYRIEKCWQIAGLQGFKVCRYLFVRCDNEPAPWTSDDHGDRPRPLPVIRELKKATVIYERTEVPSWDFDEEDSRWKWKKPPPPSRQKVQNVEPVEVARAKSDKEVKKFQLKSIKEQLQRGFSCMICKEVMVSPVTTPCAHNFCKSCLEGEFAGQAFVKERSRGGRTLRSQKNVMKCPSCSIDISDYLQNIQVDVDLKSAIESLKAKVEEIGESVESSEDADGLQDDGAGKEEDTDSGNKNSVEELNGLPEGSDVGELKDTNKGPDPAVECNGKRKKGDYGNQSPDDKMEKRGKKYKKTEEALQEENDSSSSPLNLP